MRIAFVAPFGLRAKGTARARALPLARELARRVHTVALFVPPYDSPEDAGKRWRETAGVDVVNITLPRLSWGSAAWHVWLGGRLFRAVRAWRPDVVHVFKPKGPSGLVGTAFWATRRLTIGNPRGPVSPCPRVVIDSDDWEGAGGWNDDPRAGYSMLQRRFFAWQERFGLAHADAWTVTSECLRRRAIDFGADPSRVFTLHNGTAVPQGRMTGSRDQGTAILYTRFAGTRPVDVAAIWERVRERVPDARLTVVGRGIGGEERELVGTPGVTVRGWVEPEALPALFDRMTVAIVPWADTLPNRARHSAKVLELMAAGLPIVAYAVGELPATLGEAGVLAPPGDVDVFAAAVAALMLDPGRAAPLGVAAHARVQADFVWERLADVALAAYRAAGGVPEPS